MLVLHAVWDGARFHLWAESSTLRGETPAHRGRPPARARSGPHPFILPGPALREIVDILLKHPPQSVEKISLRLPGTPWGPLPSPWLASENGPEKPTALVEVEVETVAFEPAEALDLLLDTPPRPPQGLVYADSLRFWTEAARFSLELLSREQFAPGISRGRAMWKAVIDGQDMDRFDLLSQAMPPGCRALAAFAEGDDQGDGREKGAGAGTGGRKGARSKTRSRRAGGPGGSKEKAPSAGAYPSGILTSFLDRSADAFVRRSCSCESLLPPRRGRRPRVTPMPQQFLSALAAPTAADARLEAPPEEDDSFSRDMLSWLSQAKPAPCISPFRTCFRLEPPDRSQEEEDGDGSCEDWRVSFFLQARDDPSLLVPVEEVWSSRSRNVTLLKRRLRNPQEQLLEDLGRASRLFPELDRSLQEARPSGLDLTDEQAYSFLRGSASLLEQNDFGVLLPSWWEKPGRGIGLRLTIRSPEMGEGMSASGLFGKEAILDYDWELAVGDQTLSQAEFRELSRMKVPLVRVRGEWVRLRPEDVEAAIRFFKMKHGPGKMTLDQALRLGLSAGMEGSAIGEGLPVLEVRARGWMEEMLSRLKDADWKMGLEEEFTVPPGFQGSLRPYQSKGVSWLKYLHQYGLGACLADDMGLGKTVELIAFLLRQREGGTRGPTLLICPMSVVGNWQRELQRFAPTLQVQVHHGTGRLAGQDFTREAEEQDVVLTTYALAHRDREALSAVRWRHLVLDEAQNIKNPGTRQTQAIKMIPADCRIALTGTPVENRLSELWSIMDFLNPGYLGPSEAFRREFALPIERYRNREKGDLLRKLIQPFVLRRLKTDRSIIQDLPEKVEARVYYHLTREQASLYSAVVEDMLSRIDLSTGIERKGLVLAALTKLKQVCDHPALLLQDGSPLDGRSGKLQRLEEMLDEVLESGEKALIFTQFAGMGAMLRHHLQEKLGCQALFLHGGTTKKAREDMIHRFQSDGPPLFILSLKAGGFGLNLTAANHVFHFDRWWNPAVEDQATDRAFRIGQKRNVFSHKFVCIGTLEERIDHMIEMKKELASTVIGSGEAWLTEMSTDELRDVLCLSREAVALEGD
ncbi:MAG: DEAD/DEAH box helicase [Methanosarcinales archaeon]|nr:DEAD/DEAH box helicase [Methanosarcinales archaeon]